MVHKTSNRRGYIVDYNKFETVIPIDTPICSARQISEFSDPNSPIPAFFFGQSFENRELESTSITFNKGYDVLNKWLFHFTSWILNGEIYTGVILAGDQKGRQRNERRNFNDQKIVSTTKLWILKSQ